MISDDTLMGTSLMTFPAQGTGWFGPGDFTAVKQKGPGYPVCSNHQSLFFFQYLKWEQTSFTAVSTDLLQLQMDFQQACKRRISR